MATYEIKQLQGFFPNAELVSVELNKLTSAGDNYGGALLALNVTIAENGETKSLRLVAKVLPQNEYVQKLFNSQQTFRNEVGFYQVITPRLQYFQREQGYVPVFDPVPGFFGARFSLDPCSTKVDEDGLLLIKNIKDEGFDIIDRKVGFDLEQSKLVLTKLAELHGTSYAFKNHKPEVFYQEFGPFFPEYKIFDSGNEARDEMIDSILKLLENGDCCLGNRRKVKEALLQNAIPNITKNRNELQTGLFTGIVHGDMWTNNIMIKTGDIKFVDFQMYEHSAFSRDLILFLFTSLKLEVLKQNCDELIVFYYNKLIEVLTKFNCDVSLLTLDTFLAEMDWMAKNVEFFHVMLMLRPIYALDQDTREVEDMKQDDFIHHGIGASKECQEKAHYIVHEFVRRGWL